MTTIYLVRHAESLGNQAFWERGERLTPTLLQSDLSPKGSEQLKALQKELKDLSATAWYSSPLLRAVKTAEVLRNVPEAPLQIMWELAEREEGQEPDEVVNQRFAQALEHIAKSQKSKTSIVVAHGFVIRSFLAGIGYAKMDQMPTGSLENTGWIQLNKRGEMWSVVQTKRLSLRQQ